MIKVDRSEHAENQVDEVHAGVPLVVFQERTEDEEIEQLLREWIAEEELPPQETDTGADPATNDPVQWPTQNPEPVNEYTTEGYITMAFPPLFPYGKADLRDQSERNVEVGTAEYFDALLRYKDGRFGSHPR